MYYFIKSICIKKNVKLILSFWLMKILISNTSNLRPPFQRNQAEAWLYLSLIIRLGMKLRHFISARMWLPSIWLYIWDVKALFSWRIIQSWMFIIILCSLIPCYKGINHNINSLLCRFDCCYRTVCNLGSPYYCPDPHCRRCAYCGICYDCCILPTISCPLFDCSL